MLQQIDIVSADSQTQQHCYGDLCTVHSMQQMYKQAVTLNYTSLNSTVMLNVPDCSC